jgi:hypothetical protein
MKFLSLVTFAALSALALAAPAEAPGVVDTGKPGGCVFCLQHLS